jgi:hypothetical protein
MRRAKMLTKIYAHLRAPLAEFKATEWNTLIAEKEKDSGLHQERSPPRSEHTRAEHFCTSAPTQATDTRSNSWKGKLTGKQEALFRPRSISFLQVYSNYWLFSLS